jgi:hypothetical protein
MKLTEWFLHCIMLVLINIQLFVCTLAIKVLGTVSIHCVSHHLAFGDLNEMHMIRTI